MMSSLLNWFRPRSGTVINRAGARKKTSCKLYLEALEDRTVPSTIQGTVFNDANSNAVLDGGEAGRSGWTVFLDLNENAVIDAGEPTTITDAAGHYSFDTTNVPPAFISSSGNPVDLVALKLEVGLDVGSGGGRFLNTTTPLSLKVGRNSDPDATRNFGTIFVPAAGVAPDGPETLVNQGSGGAASVSAAADGRYVVAWQSGTTISGRIFNAAGSPLTSEFTVATNASGPSVAMAGNGQFAVSWSDAQGLKARAFNSSGNPLGSGPATVVATNATTSVSSNHAAADSAGDFVIVYAVETYSSHGGWSNPTVKAQRFTPSGAANGSAITVATPTLVNGLQSVAMAGAGNFVVTWDDAVTSHSGTTKYVFAQQYTAAGKTSGSKITVATGGAIGGGFWSSAAMNPTGRFVVTYEINGGTRLAQIYNANGTPAGEPVTFASGDIVDGQAAAVAMDSAGNATFAWTGNFDDRYGLADVHMSRLLNGATVAEPVTIVNTTTEGPQFAPSVATTGNGTFVVTWQGYRADDNAGIFTQRYGPAASYIAPVAPQIESGSASVTAGVVSLSATGVSDPNSGGIVVQVAFYTDLNDDGILELLGFGTQTSPGTWTFTSSNPTTEDVFYAIALDNYGKLSNPLTITL